MVLGIVRHAKAEKDAPSGRDADRALTRHGRNQASYLAARFGAWSRRPDLRISSAAQRTRETASIIARACGLDFDFDDRLLVDRPVSGAVDLIHERAAASFLVLVGHNHQVSDLALALTRGLGRAPGGLDDSGQWDHIRELATGQAVILEVVRPMIVGGCRVVDVWRLEEE